MRDHQDLSQGDPDPLDSNLKLKMREEEEEEQIAEQMKALAIERGDRASDGRSRGLDEFDVREKTTANGKVLSSDPVVLNGEVAFQHGSVEGYTPKASITATKSGRERLEEDDIMGTI